MIQEGITQIDIKQVLRQKAPSAARKIPGFMVDYLIRTVHQDELNEILRRYHDKDGVAFMQELIGYFDLNLELVNEENIPAEGRYIFASNHPLGGLDGICLSAIIGGRFDGKIRYLVNDLLLYPLLAHCRAKWVRPRCMISDHSWSFPQAGDFASAEATRGNRNRRSLRSPP